MTPTFDSERYLARRRQRRVDRRGGEEGLAVQLRRGVPHPRLHVYLQGPHPQLPLPLVRGHGGAGGGEAEEEGG